MQLQNSVRKEVIRRRIEGSVGGDGKEGADVAQDGLFGLWIAFDESRGVECCLCRIEPASCRPGGLRGRSASIPTREGVSYHILGARTCYKLE